MRASCVLQVEDDDNDIVLLQYAFKQAGAPKPLQPVRDGTEAIEYLAGAGRFADRGQFPLPCLVLLDLKLPGKSGLEVLIWIRQNSQVQELPVMILTSSARPEDIHAAYRAGANAYLEKPSSASELLEMVKALATFWLRHNQLPPE